jgi:hypothetical protein
VKRLSLPIILFFVLLLRIPSFFEPYWYGDEGIYLALGQAMQRGAIMYRDIWDNKPPLLYLVYALHPTLLWAKVTATVFVLGTVAATYWLAKRLKAFPVIAALLTGLLLSLPLLEGTIANAELYFTLPIVLGAYVIMTTKRSLWFGLLLATAIFIKVPAGFDFAGMLLAYFFINLFGHRHDPLNTATPAKFIPVVLPSAGLFLIFILYFYFHHALADFFTASFSQNASYVAVGSGPFSRLSNPLFVKGIYLAVATGLLLALFYLKKISKEMLFLSLWFGFSLYGALLSNRPYLHYLLQIVPPAAILLVYLLANLRKYSYILIAFLFVLFATFRSFSGAFALETRSYYQNWFDYVSERKSWPEYVNYFDSRTTNSYAVAQYLDERTGPSEPIFVWGDASFVYVLANRPPATKFIQAHHLSTIPPKNFDLVMERLARYQPKYILVSRPVHFAFPALEDFLKRNYRPTTNFLDLYVYENTLPTNSPAFNVHYD